MSKLKPKGSTTSLERSGGLSERHKRWLRDDRGIDPLIAESVGCYTGTLRFALGRSTTAFVAPCLIDGVETSWQARFDLDGRPMKGFVSGGNARLNLYFGEEVMSREAWLIERETMVPLKQEDPSRIVVITEGQLDALAVRQAGFVGLSLPNGCMSMEWIERWAPLLGNLRRVVVWIDNDLPDSGAYEASMAAKERLRTELHGGIHFVGKTEFQGQHLKDANEALLAGGEALVTEIVRSARSAMGGHYNIRPSKLFHPVRQFKTGIDWLDAKVVLCGGEHTAIIGRTNRGKSKFANFWAYMAAKRNDTKCYWQAFETIADGELSGDLAEFEVGLPLATIMADPALYEKALTAIQERVVALEPALVPATKDPMGAAINRIIEQADDGVRIHVIDNYAMVQTFMKGKDPNAQTREDILELNDVARRYNAAIIVVYHTRKIDQRWRLPNTPPDIEDASGSASIGNHCCVGLSVERCVDADGGDSNSMNISVQKARRPIHGKRGNFWIWLNNAMFDFGGDGHTLTDVAKKKQGKPMPVDKSKKANAGDEEDLF